MLHSTLQMGADLPVRQVVLYKNGVGYFERSGQLAAGQSARIDFKASEMNDVLKSLSVVQKGGGAITGVRYDSSEPLQTKLGEFPFRVESGQALSAFLDQLKGAHVELKMLSGETAGGTIVSARKLPGDEKKNERELLLLQADSGELRNFDLGVMASLKLSDPALELELKRFLGTLTAARSKDKKSIYLDSTNDQARQLALSYMIPMPVWKSSYRLIFGDAGSPTLEGWAIVDNTTGEDWNGVQLALVSGKPVSFISKLYEPKYVQRRTADLADQEAAGPVLYESAMADQMAKAAAPPPPAMARRQALAAQVPEVAAMQMLTVAGNASSIAVDAQGREAGDLFEYRFGSPVTVRKNESAMLPFLQQKLTARKLLIYSHGSAGQNPMNAAEITNSSGKTLDGGPLTVFDANSYAGEALMETLKANDKRLISYAVDLGTRVTTNFESGRDLVRELKAKNGVITSKTAIEEKTTYSIRNIDQKAKTLVIEHPLRPDYRLLGELKPTEKTANKYRFEVKLAPGVTDKFVVAEERLLELSIQISDLDHEQLLIYVRNRNLSDAARKQLEQLAQKQDELARVEGELRRLEGEIGELVKDQERIRQNMQSLNRVNGQEAQVRKYSSDLAASESKLATLRDQQSEGRKRAQALRQEADALAAKLEF